MKNVEDIYALTPMQQGMLFHALYANQSGMYLEQKSCTLVGSLNATAFVRAWQEVIDRHTALRSAFLWKGLDKPLQVVRKQASLVHEFSDWRASSETQQQEQLEAYLRRDRDEGVDLSRAPLMRIALFQTDDHEHLFVWTHHHLILDGWSLPIIFKEVFSFYEAANQSRQIALPSPRRYRDYIAWLERQDISAAEQFWREELTGLGTATQIAPGISNEKSPTIYGEEHLLLSEAESQAVAEFSRTHGLTINTLAQAAWGLVLAQLTGRQDVVFGATVSGRPTDLPGVESMVGLFINTLPVRVRIDDGGSETLEWLNQLQKRQVQARQYEFTPLAQTRAWSDLPREQSLFDTLLVYENYPTDMASSDVSPSLQIRDFNARERGNYPLVIKATSAGRISLGTLHDTRQFQPDFIQSLLRKIQLVLTTFASEPHRPLSTLSTTLRDAEKKERKMKKRKRREINLASFENVNPSAVSSAATELVKRDYVNDTQYPLVVTPALDDVDVIDWARSHLDEIDSDLARHGAILFRGFGVMTPDEFQNFALAVCSELFDEYGDLPREKDKVYKSTPYPEDKTILFHNESSHMHRWPMKQFFGCMIPSQEGGETPIVDCRRVYQELDREIVEQFQEKGLLYVRNFVESLDVSWRDFFGTEDRSKVEDYCERNRIEFAWTAKDGLRTKQRSPGVAKHPKTGEFVFFNQVQLHHPACLDGAMRDSVEQLFQPEEMPRNVFYGDGSPIPDAVIQEILRVYWDVCAKFPWERGDVIMVDNMLTAHARNPFRGQRKIVVALADMMDQTRLEPPAKVQPTAAVSTN